jgi:hypothetical protein
MAQNIQEWWKAKDTPAIQAAKAELVRLAPELVVLLGLDRAPQHDGAAAQGKTGRLVTERFPWTTVYRIVVGETERYGPFGNKAAAIKYAKQLGVTLEAN